MADHSPERKRRPESGGVSEATDSDGQDPNPLANAFRKLGEGRGREAASLYHDVVKPRPTPLMVHIERGIRHDELGRHESAIEECLAARDLDPDNVDQSPVPH